VLLAAIVLVGFLRGLLTNLGTPPVASDIRSILVRPRLFKNEIRQNTIFHYMHYSLYGRGVKHVHPGETIWLEDLATAWTRLSRSSKGFRGFDFLLASYSNSPFQFGSSRRINDRSSRPRIPHLR
jgi:hypothetical protein